MPCWTIQRNTLDLKVANIDLLEKAIKGLPNFNVHRVGDVLYIYKNGYQQGVIADGKITVNQGFEAMVDDIKQAYGREAVKLAAQKYNFTLRPGLTQNRIKLTRRG